jgi:isocitrate/isopropylmalate dehydrogenase
MKNLRIAVLPGDGIGSEVMNEAVSVLALLKKLDTSFSLEWELHSNWRNDARKWVRNVKTI